MLRVTTQNLGDVTVFRIAGRITAGDGDCLRNAVRNAPDTRVAVLDLADVSAIDAAGLGTLVSLRNWARTSGTRLKLMNLTPWVDDVLRLTGLTRAFDICTVHDMVDLICRASDPARFAPARMATAMG
jgi:anti-sigma B factor antagonist